MPNINSPYGFHPIGVNLYGGRLQLFPFKKPAALNAVVAPGDILASDANGEITRTLTPGTTRLLGVAQGFSPALAEVEMPVCIDPGQIYSAMVDGAFTLDMQGNTARVKLGAAITAGPVRSQDVVDSTTIGGNEAGDDLRIIRLEPIEDNAFGDYAKVLVVFNKSRFVADQAGI